MPGISTPFVNRMYPGLEKSDCRRQYLTGDKSRNGKIHGVVSDHTISKPETCCDGTLPEKLVRLGGSSQLIPA
ncbi:Uncharacterized protein APZ42_020236 [Daphnia magna]|uniref:Uncharacterized protein n=1 Tax=Daphnia magna TaxID=35525 RepID=A0A164Y3T2_9CRUS|nr:Uncharacterized protein APZ42_020236 [Daphnia magna]